MDQAGFLGTDATLAKDLTLAAYVLLLVPLMLVGYRFARRKQFEPNHKYTMTAIMIFNWVLILLVMVASYRDGVAPNLETGEFKYVLPTIHLITGATAQALATYLVIRMWFEKSLPGWFKVKRIKRYMRTTLALWLTTAALGALIYITWYVSPSSDDETVPTPAATEQPASPGDDIPLPAVTEEGADPAEGGS